MLLSLLLWVLCLIFDFYALVSVLFGFAFILMRKRNCRPDVLFPLTFCDFPDDAMGWSALRDRGVSYSYSLTLFYKTIKSE